MRFLFQAVSVLALLISIGCGGDGGSSNEGPFLDITFISIPGGVFEMGSNDDDLDWEWEEEQPVHSVRVLSFEMSKSEVTVGQYRVCVDAGVCREPTCNFPATMGSREDHPVTCLSWSDAKTFAEFAGARLPSESEWEYAARSGGQDTRYPWGNDFPDCTRLNFVNFSGFACEQTTTPVCSYPAGNTAQGLCDMSGNVEEWVEDDLHADYTGAPNDGSAWIENPRLRGRVLRGGSFLNAPDRVRATYRSLDGPSRFIGSYGFRLARDAQ